MFKFNRRQFLYFTGGLTLATATAKTDFSMQGMEIPPSEMEIQVWHPEAKPFAVQSLKELYFLNLEDEPIPPPPRRVEPGKLFSQLPPFPLAIALKLPVLGFGEVVLYADNQGRGYTGADFSLNLNLEFARTRLYRVRQALVNWRKAGISFPKSLESRLEKADSYLRQGETTDSISAKIRWCNQSLAESLWAGEEAIAIAAKQQISQQGLRPNFLFGCNFFGYSQPETEYDRLFQQLFNFATIPFYWRIFEPELGKKNFARTDAMVNWLEGARIVPKGHPLVWFQETGIPDWLADKPYSEIKKLTYQRVLEITRHYGGRIPYYDIINEANGIAWANELNYSLEQFLELTRIASEASRAGFSQVNRIINNCCLWAENVAYDKPPQYSPYQYLKACLEAEIPFEVIGLQVYYPHQDMLEINRLLERFSQLGKPIHITELGVSSATLPDQNAFIKKPSGLWHEPWSEKIQADWIEQFYTLCYSKPYIEAITWWDFSDRGSFLPHAGLLRQDMTAKESFYRLSNLLQQMTKD
jgi:GH35 family endo-1,4-beta-xylanase